MILRNLALVLFTSLGTAACLSSTMSPAPVAPNDGPSVPFYRETPPAPPSAEPGWGPRAAPPPTTEPGLPTDPSVPMTEPGWAPAPDDPACGNNDGPSIPMVRGAVPPPSVEPFPSAPAWPAGRWQFGGLIKLPGVQALPAHGMVPVVGYPGSSFHLGAITSDAEWQVFAAAARIPQAPRLAPGEMVVFAVLDAQTNVVVPRSIVVDGCRVVMTIDWQTVEPYYLDATPAALAIVDRGDARLLQVGHRHGPIGDFAIP